MSEQIIGTLQVSHNVELERQNDTIEVIVTPLQAAISFEEIRRRSVQAFRHLDGMQVTLEGDRHGDVLASARIVQNIQPKAGVYHGRLVSAMGRSIIVDLRFDPGANLVSADFFLGNQRYFASLRTTLTHNHSTWEGASPRVIFDGESASNLGGSISLDVQSSDVINVTCLLPENTPTVYQGSTAFEVSDFRILNIEVDKLDGMPWPPSLSTADIPENHQLPNIEVQELSIEALFRKAGIAATVQHNDGALDRTIGERAGRPAEQDRWDEREMHELMDCHYSRNLSDREWWLYLLIVPRFDGGPAFRQGGFLFDDDNNIRNDGEGTTGIIFDSRTGAISDPWSPWLERVFPQFRHLFDFGREGSFQNVRARQGVAVFWQEIADIFDQLPAWDRDRRFLRTILHELGHALNLAHTWLVNRVGSTSFMQYPHRFPRGQTLDERDQNYWRNFDYSFDPEELFHLRHGFLNEVIPGGHNEFMQWTPSSIFGPFALGNTRANISLHVQPGKAEYQFTEPVTFDVRVRNHSPNELPIGRLSPSYSHIRYILRRPTGDIIEYQPPLYKCEVTRTVLRARDEHQHTTSLTVGAGGFTFDIPGRYEISAALPDPSTGAVVMCATTGGLGGGVTVFSRARQDRGDSPGTNW